MSTSLNPASSHGAAKAQYFKTLAAGLPKDPYKERLLRELSDHWDDVEAAPQKPHKSPDQNTPESHLGSPENFIHFYSDFMKHTARLYTEAAWIGLLSAPLAGLGLFGNALTEQTRNIPFKFVIWAATLWFAGWFFKNFYAAVWTYLKRITPTLSSRSHQIASALLLAPTLIAYFFVTCTIAGLMPLDQDFFFPVVMGAYGVIQAVIATKWAPKLPFQAQQKVELFAAAFILILSAIQYTGGLLQVLREAIFFVMQFAILLPVQAFFKDPILGYQLLGLLVTLLLVYCTGDSVQGLVKHREWRFGKVLVAIGLGALLTIGLFTPQKPLIEWDEPVVSLTGKFEYDSLGIFTPFYRFLRAQGLEALSYPIFEGAWTNEGVMVSLNPTLDRILFSNFDQGLDAVTWERIGPDVVIDENGKVHQTVVNHLAPSSTIPSDEDENLLSLLLAKPLPEASSKDFEGLTQGDCRTVMLLPEMPLAPACQGLFYKDHRLYKSTVPLEIQTALISPDKKWILIHFGEQHLEGATQFDEVFLLRLPEL